MKKKRRGKSQTSGRSQTQNVIHQKGTLFKKAASYPLTKSHQGQAKWKVHALGKGAYGVVNKYITKDTVTCGKGQICMTGSLETVPNRTAHHQNKKEVYKYYLPHKELDYFKEISVLNLLAIARSAGLPHFPLMTFPTVTMVTQHLGLNYIHCDAATQRSRAINFIKYHQQELVCDKSVTNYDPVDLRDKRLEEQGVKDIDQHMIHKPGSAHMTAAPFTIGCCLNAECGEGELATVYAEKQIQLDQLYIHNNNQLPDEVVQNYFIFTASLICQCFMASFLAQAVTCLPHNDTHLGNFLYVKLKGGGNTWIKYTFEKGSLNKRHETYVYIKTAGYYIIIWDFGMVGGATRRILYPDAGYPYDYFRIMGHAGFGAAHKMPRITQGHDNTTKLYLMEPAYQLKEQIGQLYFKTNPTSFDYNNIRLADWEVVSDMSQIKWTLSIGQTWKLMMDEFLKVYTKVKYYDNSFNIASQCFHSTTNSEESKEFENTIKLGTDSTNHYLNFNINKRMTCTDTGLCKTQETLTNCMQSQKCCTQKRCD